MTRKTYAYFLTIGLCSAVLACGENSAQIIQAPSAPDTGAQSVDTAIGTNDNGPTTDAGTAGLSTGQSCTQDFECTSGRCTWHLGDKVCSPPTCDAQCVGAWTCINSTCVSKFPALCKPCVAQSDCADNPEGTDCVHYDGAGGFCGAGCDSSADCPVGWQCAAANLTTGGQSSQCVPNSGACQCSAAASAQQLVSWCSGGDVGCAGTRTCTVNGLGPCLSGTPSEEVCNGADDDCDGIKDEDACDDNNECTQDTCNGTSGCTYTPLNAGSCGGICVTNGVCVNGECTGANALDCDDGDPCTTDTCDPVLGCQNTPVVGPCNPSDDCVPGTSECAPGEQDVETQACGACGSQTRTRTCSDQCAWGEWSDWSACSSESVCSPGETEQETQACGDCGSQVRTRSCTNACDWTAWSSWSSCSGAGICSPGQVETQNQSCGNCGSQSRTRSCTAQCAWNSWGSWSGCNGQGACSPGQVETQNQSCGNCGSQSRTRSCNSGCGWNSWSSWGSCDSQGACAPGEVSDSGCDACAQKTCSNSCEWSQCNLKPGAQCLWESGANWQCCGAGKWQFCLGPNYGCIWSNQCEACSGCGC